MLSIYLQTRMREKRDKEDKLVMTTPATQIIMIINKKNINQQDARISKVKRKFLYKNHLISSFVFTAPFKKTVSQSCAVAISEKFWRATAQSTWRTNGWLANKSFQCLVFVLTQLQFRQWSSLPFCLPSLIVQRPARIVYFSLLRMIVKLVYRTIAWWRHLTTTTRMLWGALRFQHFWRVKVMWS